MEQRTKKQLYTYLKIIVTGVLLTFVIKSISFAQVLNALTRVNPKFFAVALLCFVLSQIISARRLFVLFRSQDFGISRISNYKLYLLGMFYNFFIPGGVGGDAYKVFILNKTFKWPIKKLSAVIFIDRFYGFVAISFIVVLLEFFVPYFREENLLGILGLAFLGGIILTYYIIKKWFKSFLSVSIVAIALSLVIQILQCVAVLFILLSISVQPSEFVIYILVFLVSSVLSIFSFSGIGVREMIFLQASTIFLFDDTKAVAVGLLFSIITAFIALFGIVYHFKSQKRPYLKQRIC
ncbi:hypothetical protein PW52_04845 [Tamlana sedimentorum]|uniref:Lysylphosphatidylglycerol synthetase n=1 Tax=Neotamlana sedimentorum TaxID=1435349 RepID=A0A0D7WCQ4_9FLAO|nr:lysylphosphatidylglycerol synthase transmembrane domain-containing protein [Tamlana sedimentorum]KJD36483.1 hypothetical protein PW52_04845 [Tamlana sedimentorum]